MLTVYLLLPAAVAAAGWAASERPTPTRVALAAGLALVAVAVSITSAHPAAVLVAGVALVAGITGEALTR